MANPFKKAVKTECKLRLAIIGPSGSGKTYTSLRMARALGKRIAFIDTERKSASKYANEFDFDVLELEPPYHPERYMEFVQIAQREGYDVCIIDSLSHMWTGQGGILEIVDEEARKSKSGNTFNAWKKGTPLYNKMIDCFLGSTMHIIGTMRSKSEYVVEQNANGKSTPKKVGTAAIQRDGFEYEFDIIMEMNQENEGNITKTRCSPINGKLITRPGEEFAGVIKAWLEDGAPEPAPKAAPSPEFMQALKAVGAVAMEALAEFNDDGQPNKFATVAAIRATLADWHTEDPTCCGLDEKGVPALNACSLEQLSNLMQRFQGILNASKSAAQDRVAKQQAEIERQESAAKPAGKSRQAKAPKVEPAQEGLPFGATPEAVGQSDPWGEDDEGRWSSDGEVEREPVEMG